MDKTDYADSRFHDRANAQECADKQTDKTGRLWLVTDTPNCSPRYAVVEVPAVGDEVSYGFNGDYYPDGKVIRVSRTFVVTTSTGNRYYRRGLTGTWKQSGGTWSLVRGHINERNPSF